MPLVRRRIIPLPLEHMPQVPSTITTHNLRPCHSERAVSMPRHGPRDRVEVRGPPAAGLEFVVGFVERGVAGGAGVDAGVGLVFVERVREGRFRAFFAEDAELF